MSKTIKITAHIHGSMTYGNEVHYSVFDVKDMTACGYFHVASQEIEVDLPDGFEPTVQAIMVLEQQKARVKAELTNKLTEIDREIASLQALPA